MAVDLELKQNQERPMNQSDQEKILAAISLLEMHPRWNKTLPDAVRIIMAEGVPSYFDSIGDFITAVKISINEDAFFPNLLELQSKISGGRKAEAMTEWLRVLQLSQGNPDLVDLSVLSQRTKAALASVGGIRKLGYANEDSAHRFEKRFLDYYTLLNREQVDEVNLLLPQAKKQIAGTND